MPTTNCTSQCFITSECIPLIDHINIFCNVLFQILFFGPILVGKSFQADKGDFSGSVD